MVGDIAIKGAKTKKSSLEDILDDVKRVPENKSGAKYVSAYKPTFPLKSINDEIDLTQYREVSLPGLVDLSESLKKHCLLEPITLSYNTENDSWKMLDGRRRFGAAMIAGFDYMPVKIYYNLPPEIEERLMVSLNATKEKISSADIATWLKELKEHILHYNESRPLNPIPITNSSLGSILSRSPGTISTYNTFNNLPSLIIDYVRLNPELKLFSKGVDISRKILSPKHQLKFFDYFKERLQEDVNKKDEKEKLKKKNHKFTMDELRNFKPLSRTDFKKDLTSFADEFNSKKEYEEQNGKNALYLSNKLKFKSSSNPAKELIKNISDVKKYVANFKKLLDVSQEFSKDFLNSKFDEKTPSELILKLIDSYTQLLSESSEKTQTSVYNFLTKKETTKDENYTRFITEKRSGEKKNGGYVLQAIGDNVVDVPIDMVELEESQVRSTYNDSSIDDLAEEMELLGQVKPGLLKPIYDKSDSIVKYKLIYGHRRYKAAKKANLKTYSAFLRDDVDKADAGLLQSIEDLSERDSTLERAKKLYSQFNLIRQQRELQGKSYDLDTFIKEHKSLQSPKTIRDSFALLSLPEELQYCVDKKLISKPNAILASELSTGDQFAILYNSLVSQIGNQKLKGLITKKIDEEKIKTQYGISQQALFEKQDNSHCVALRQFDSRLNVIFKTFNSFIKYNKNKSYMRNGQGKAVYLAMAGLVKEISPICTYSKTDISVSYTKINYKQ